MDAPTIYYVHPDTLEYIGNGFADPSPLEEGKWLIPAFAYTDALPEQCTGYAIVRNQLLEAWELVEDNRGTVYLTANGEARDHLTLGPLPAELTRVPYPGPFHIWNGSQWVADAEAQYDKALAEAIALCDRKLTEAAVRILPLEDAADIGEASEEEQAALLAWKRYRIDLSRVSQQPGYPLSFKWPTSPDQTRAEQP